MINFQRIIYILKRQYGTILDIYRETNSTFDVEIGKVTVIRTRYRIKKAVVLPSDIKSESPFLRRANLLFKESGQIETDKRNIIIDRRDISIVIDPLKDYIVYKGDRYGIDIINMIDNHEKVLGYHLVLTKAKTEIAYEQHYVQLNDRLSIGDIFTNE